LQGTEKNSVRSGTVKHLHHQSEVHTETRETNEEGHPEKKKGEVSKKGRLGGRKGGR